MADSKGFADLDQKEKCLNDQFDDARSRFFDIPLSEMKPRDEDTRESFSETLKKVAALPSKP